MKSGLSPRVKLFQTHALSPPSPQMWSVSVRMTLLPSEGGGSVSYPPELLGEIQSAGLLKRFALEPPGYWKVMPTGCCLDNPLSSPWMKSIIWYCQSVVAEPLEPLSLAIS